MSKSAEEFALRIGVARIEFPHFGVEQIVEEQAPIPNSLRLCAPVPLDLCAFTLLIPNS